jgi:hypothetical protein
VDKWQFTLTVECRQGEPIPRIPLGREERRRLLGASIRLLGYRYDAGKRISREDFARIALFADDGDTEIVPCTRLVLGADDAASPGP